MLQAMGAILDLPEVRARVFRWTVADYVELAEDNLIFRHLELIRGIIVEKCGKVLCRSFSLTANTFGAI